MKKNILSIILLNLSLLSVGFSLDSQILLTTSSEISLKEKADLSSLSLKTLPAHKNVELLDYISDGEYGGWFKIRGYGINGYIQKNSVIYDDAYYLAIKVQNGNITSLCSDNKMKLIGLSKRKVYEESLWAKQVGFENESYTDLILSLEKLISTEKPPQILNTFYKDGNMYQYYIYGGISVTIHLSIEKNYGKYYVAYIAVENLTGKAFNFNPDNIKVTLIKNSEESIGEVLSNDEYMQKVDNRQATAAALVAFGEFSSANQAGHSSTTTTSTTSGYSNSYGNASGYYGKNQINISGSSSTHETETTKSNTKTYDGAINYAAKQNAQQNINDFQNEQYQIRNVLNQGYLKLNTIENEERIVGQINIKYKDSDKIKISIPINGANYDFWWDNN